MDSKISQCPLQLWLLWFLCSNWFLLAALSALYPQPKHCQMQIWEVPVHWWTKDLGQQRFKNLSGPGRGKKVSSKGQMEKIFVLKASVGKRCICLLLCVPQLPCRNAWVRKFHSLLTLLWMSYCAGSFATHWFLLGWNQTIVQGCSCQSHNPCGYSASSEKQSVEQSPGFTKHLQLLLLPSSNSATVFGGFSDSQPFLLRWASAAGERARTMPNKFFQFTFVHVCIHKHFVTVIQLHILVEGVNFFFFWSSWKEK